MRRKDYRYLIAALVSLLLLTVPRSAVRHSCFKALKPHYAGAGLPERAVVKRVIDGDTIIVGDDLRVRYIGINTPETKHPKRAVEYFGKEAWQFNKQLVEKKEVTLEYDVQKFDKYGRALAYVYVGDIFVNAKLVEEGYAQAFTMPPDIKYAGVFVELQRKAKAGRKGLWNRNLTNQN